MLKVGPKQLEIPIAEFNIQIATSELNPVMNRLITLVLNDSFLKNYYWPVV